MSLEGYSPELSLALNAARCAGDVLIEHLDDGVQFREKAEGDLVSGADFASEAVIVDMIRNTFPTHEILAEESFDHILGDGIPEHLWIIDPLDGTTNFAHGIPHFAVSIAYLHRGRVQCGVVYNPARFEWYVAARGSGAWFNDTRIFVSDEASLSQSLVGLGFYYDRGIVMEATLATIHKLFKTGIHGVRRFGAASLDLAHVARGMYGTFFEYQLAPWDFAAGLLLVEEAGGRCSTAIGTQLPFAKTSVLASNGKLHQQMLQIIDETAGHLFVRE